MQGIETECMHCGIVGYALGLYWYAECRDKAACRDRCIANEKAKSVKLQRENEELRKQLEKHEQS